MIVFIFTGKNSGLKDLTDEVLSSFLKISTIIKVRGEDVPVFTDRFNVSCSFPLGITGYDLLKEYTSKTPGNCLEEIAQIDWNDPSALYGKPALCLFGFESQYYDGIPRTVAYANKYEEEVKRFIIDSPLKDYNLLPLSGGVEQALIWNIASYGVDIVSTGRTLAESGLKLIQKISESNLVIIGKRDNK